MTHPRAKELPNGSQIRAGGYILVLGRRWGGYDTAICTILNYLSLWWHVDVTAQYIVRVKEMSKCIQDCNKLPHALDVASRH